MSDRLNNAYELRKRLRRVHIRLAQLALETQTLADSPEIGSDQLLRDCHSFADDSMVNLEQSIGAVEACWAEFESGFGHFEPERTETQ